MQHPFHRDRFTWLAYLSLALYGYFLNVLGPITPFIKDELHLTHTVSSFHFTAFAVGILLIGVGGHLVIQRIGRGRSLWLGPFGLSLGAPLLLAGRNPVVTIGASFLMGLVGSLILAIVPAALSDRHGGMKAVAHSVNDWSWALGLMAFAPILMFLAFGRDASPAASSYTVTLVLSEGSLPPRFWLFWASPPSSA